MNNAECKDVSHGRQVVVHAEFAEGGFGFVDFLFADATFGGDLDGKLEFEALGGGELGEHSGVKFHPFLERHFAGPGHGGEY
jgi:hypothetical protein